MVFLLEITNFWQKSRDFWVADFFLKFLKSIGWYEILVVLNMFHQCFD
jgi:hypothetical protein